VLAPDEAQEDYRKWGKRQDDIISLALELEKIEVGGQLRLVFAEKRDAVRIQRYARQAAELAGWYKDIEEPAGCMTFRTSLKDMKDMGYILKIQRLRRPVHTTRRSDGKVNTDNC